MKKVVLISGASAGIGKETAKVLLQEGYIVYGAARRVDLMKDLEVLGAKIIAMDVANEESMTSCIEEIIRNEHRIDVLINNAGFGTFGAIEDVPMKTARYQIEVNLFGLARLTQLVLPFMREQKSGKIVNITSTGGKAAGPMGGWYHASKFAVEALSDSLRLEVKRFGIDVIVIEPGGVKTEWGNIAFGGMKEISGHTVYQPMVAILENLGEKAELNNVDPDVIAQLIKKSLTASKPKARYVAGYLAKPILFMKKWLSDAMFDKLVMSQLK